jgi:NAD-dependent dihydropyrimidine dehydrogenase PreA subunit
VVSGVGFLGAGMIILKNDNVISGLTTAAGVWATATLGIAIGYGFYTGSLIATFIFFIALTLFTKFERKKRNTEVIYIELTDMKLVNPTLSQIFQVLPKTASYRLEPPRSGYVGHIGITLHDVKLFEKALELDWVETIMFPYNIVETQAEELIKKCGEKGIGFICMKPLAGGAIEDATLAMRFIGANPNVSVVIPGMADIAEVEQNIAAANDGSPLTEAELAAMQKVRDELGTNFCRRCNYCQPCSAGINISGAFLFEGYYNRYGLQDWAAGRYLAMPKTASDCVDCGLCEERCPYNLPIRQMLKKVANVFGK